MSLPFRGKGRLSNTPVPFSLTRQTRSSPANTQKETLPKVLNQSVKLNIKRFPESFRFQISDYELNELKLNKEQSNRLRSQYVTSSSHGGRRYLPYVFSVSEAY